MHKKIRHTESKEDRDHDDASIRHATFGQQAGLRLRTKNQKNKWYIIIIIIIKPGTWLNHSSTLYPDDSPWPFIDALEYYAMSRTCMCVCSSLVKFTVCSVEKKMYSVSQMSTRHCYDWIFVRVVTCKSPHSLLYMAIALFHLEKRINMYRQYEINCFSNPCLTLKFISPVQKQAPSIVGSCTCI